MENKNQEKNPLLELIEEAMAKKGIKKNTELASLSGVSEAVISRFRGGTAMLSAHNVYKLLSALDLLGGEGKVPNRTGYPALDCVLLAMDSDPKDLKTALLNAKRLAEVLDEEIKRAQRLAEKKTATGSYSREKMELASQET